MNTKSYSLAWRDLALWRGDRCLQSGLSGQLDGGQALTLRGPNGCGKTTLLRTLCGLSEPETGDILWQNQSVRRNRADFHAHLAYAGHSNGMKGELSTRENLRFSALMRGRHTNQNELLHWLGLTRCADLPVHSLSAGHGSRDSPAFPLPSSSFRVFALARPTGAATMAPAAFDGDDDELAGYSVSSTRKESASETMSAQRRHSPACCSLRRWCSRSTRLSPSSAIPPASPARKSVAS